MSTEHSCLLVEKPQKEPRKSDLEKTIEAMEGSSANGEGDASDGLCAHPLHLHSFQQVNFLLTLRNCAGCQARIQTVVFGSGNDSARQVVRCLACGVYAHRQCAMNAQLAKSLWKGPCPVNQATMKEIKHRRRCSDRAFATAPAIDFGEASSGECVTHADEPTLSSGSKKNSSVPPDNESKQSLTEETPPEHWTSVAESSPPEDNDRDVGKVNDAPLHYASHPFASVSRALQENILAHFRNTTQNRKEPGIDTEIQPDEIEPLVAKVTPPLSTVDKSDSAIPPQHNPVIQFVNGTVDAVRTSVSIPGRLGAAAVAGGIAGGVAGLCLAGPAGSIAGYQLGRTAGALGVLLEGSVSVGVLVASVATGSAAGQHLHDHLEERRILEMGERGASRKVLLVRPNIKIDSTWEVFCKEAVTSAPKKGGFFAPHSATRDLHRRDEDIVKPSEDEIPTSDKVFLLVSRILNDKESLPGHVYRSLIDKFFERVQSRRELQEEGYTDSEVSGRSCRDDVHAIIKFVTATLLEVRPGLDASPATTELTATAVESLVFGKVYDDVINEIIEEVSDKDIALTGKIEQCDMDPKHVVSRDVSEKALKALQRIPIAHSSVDKLEDCVRFLELISEHFASSSHPAENLCADSLLKMVCQHILVAKVDHLNAEITFLEEFARDEQLLRGREGYSLVTLQAGLHFLNMCENVESDIFGQDNEEENLPLEKCCDIEASAEEIL